MYGRTTCIPESYVKDGVTYTLKRVIFGWTVLGPTEPAGSNGKTISKEGARYTDPKWWKSPEVLPMEFPMGLCRISHRLNIHYEAMVNGKLITVVSSGAFAEMTRGFTIEHLINGKLSHNCMDSVVGGTP